MNFWSAYLAYRLIELLARPFKEWDAFKLGLIDDKGETIKQPVLSDEKKAFGMFEKIIRNIKQILNKAIGQSRTAALLSTIYLIKEHDEDVAKVVLNYCIGADEDLKEFLKTSNKVKQALQEAWEGSTELIYKGTYTLRGKTFKINEDIYPFDKFVGIYIYKYKDEIFTKQELNNAI